MEEQVAVVRGRRIERVSAAELQKLSRQYEAVVIDVGAGDGRWLYRLARSRPDVLCLGVDANAEALREASYRAGRKPARGGLPNLRFIASGAESLPGGLSEMADEVWVSYPWGSLLRAVLAPDAAVLRRIGGLLKPCGVLRVAINAALLSDAAALGKSGVPLRTADDLCDAVRAGYNEAGLDVTTWRVDDAQIRSSWAGRLGQGAGLRTLWVEAVKDGNGRGHGAR